MVPELISKYEIPVEYHVAMWEAYKEGVKRGFIEAMVTTVRKPEEAS